MRDCENVMRVDKRSMNNVNDVRCGKWDRLGPLYVCMYVCTVVRIICMLYDNLVVPFCTAGFPNTRAMMRGIRTPAIAWEWRICKQVD